MPKAPEPLPVSAYDLKDLQSSGLTYETVKANRIHTDRTRTNLVFPYPNLNGEFNDFSRKKPHNPRVTDSGKIIKYEQPAGSPPRAYFPIAAIKKLKDEGQPLFITEGEKKALALAQEGYAAVGIGGVECGQSNGEPIADIAALPLQGREVYVVFDFDEKPTTRENVQKAKSRLAKALYAAGVRTVFHVAMPPSPNGEKYGVDDLLVEEGPRKLNLLVNSAAPIRGGHNSLNLISSANSDTPTLDRTALHGVFGDYIDAIAPYTEATAAGILAHLLSATGAIIGPGPRLWAGGWQPARINTLVVGRTATGLKGTSATMAGLALSRAYPDFYKDRKASGLSSGEGLIVQVQDVWTEGEDGEDELVITDKRLWVLEPEFSRVLANMKRETNILSQILRETYDSGNLSTLTVNPRTVSGAHISVIGHITPAEFKDRIPGIEAVNGFLNRFLIWLVESDKVMPLADPPPEKLLNGFIWQFRQAIDFASDRDGVELSPEAKALWNQVYPELRREQEGLVGAVTARGKSIVLRLALLYALMDCCPIVWPVHLRAALAVWQYSIDSAAILFKDARTRPVTLADKVLDRLREGRLKTSDFYSTLNVSANELRPTLEALVGAGRVQKTKVSPEGRGRPTEYWSLVVKEN
ncbi:DUF3854 domain-containing protein [Stratiformator vulcanicus]|uniref:DUF3854 domain-containing protein n=1 Tax=Stratiformator vulcanicus TaxID=2527980 RepID=A0A517R5S9_9PLAN|nr:DUF3854 domain-containing protein [Stratiformator vulcanicus]QDT39231.1 hypothetical protein Pan189_36340 [Stratiformator vulcanicus]